MTRMTNHANSTLIYKSRCPSCSRLGMDTRGDNLAHYSDNHSFCFACGYYDNPITNRLQCINKQPDILADKSIAVKLPGDISIEYPAQAIAWITRYDITREDLHNHNFLWSEHYQRLIYPVWQDEQCIFWAGRYFGEDTKKPKWRNCGSPKDIIHLLNGDANRIIIVEDIISGIKIRKACKDFGVLVLFNSHSAIDKLLKITKDRNKKYVYWLDNDKFRASIFFSKEAVGHGLDIQTICSDRDPKDESINSIKRILNESN